MHFAKPSPRALAFDSAGLPSLSVIRVAIAFGKGESQEKLLVIAFHDGSHAVCMKATSKVELYRNNADKMAGAIFIPAREVPCFPLDTVIQPDNLFPVPHLNITSASVAGELPDQYRLKLIHAVERSSSLTEVRRARLLRELRANGDGSAS